MQQAHYFGHSNNLLKITHSMVGLTFYLIILFLNFFNFQIILSIMVRNHIYHIIYDRHRE